MKPDIIIVTGPTASGKSGAALSIAESSGGVIINADSQQMYRELRILTARPTPEEEARAPHKLYGMLGAGERCSAGMWLRLARMEIDWARSQGKLPIIVGGTGLYLKALLQGIADIPDIPEAVRAQAENDYGAMGREAFAERLRVADPAFFTRLKVYDRQRLVRAYSVWLGTGKPLSWWQEQEASPPYPRESFRIFQMDIPRPELYRRCDARFIQMLKAGALEEVKALFSLPRRGRVGVGAYGTESSPACPPPNLPPAGGGIFNIIGAKELLAHLQGERSLEEAAADARQATRNYAKRQLTWFRHQLPDAVKISDAAQLSKNCHFPFGK